MKKVVFGLLVAVLVAGSAAVFAGDQDFTLINKTGLVIDQVYVSPTSVNDWEEDVLGQDTLPNGDKVHITFSRDTKECLWDLKIVDEDDDEVVWTKLDLCAAEEVTLKYEKGEATAIIK